MKLLGDCPNCKEKVTFDLDKEKKVIEPKELQNQTRETQQILEQPKEKIVEKEVIKTVIEDFKPNYECPDGDCDIGVHKNKNYSKKPKGKCTNCGQFTKHDKGTCPWCKGTELEELEDGDLEDLGITDPVNDEHEGHNHE